MKKNETEKQIVTTVTETPATKRPALARSKDSVRTAIRAGAGKADLVNCM